MSTTQPSPPQTPHTSSIPISKQIKENGRFSGLFPGWGGKKTFFY